MKNKHLIWMLLIVVGFLFSQCKTEQRPELPIQEEKLAAMLADISVAEVSIQGLSSDIRDSLVPIYYGDIFAIHKVERATFNAAIDTLIQYPEWMMEVYGKAQDIIDEQNK